MRNVSLQDRETRADQTWGPTKVVSPFVHVKVRDIEIRLSKP